MLPRGKRRFPGRRWPGTANLFSMSIAQRSALPRSGALPFPPLFALPFCDVPVFTEVLWGGKSPEWGGEQGIAGWLVEKPGGCCFMAMDRNCFQVPRPSFPGRGGISGSSHASPQSNGRAYRAISAAVGRTTRTGRWT